MPLDLVVKKGLNSRSAFSAAIPMPQSATAATPSFVTYWNIGDTPTLSVRDVAGRRLADIATWCPLSPIRKQQSCCCHERHRRFSHIKSRNLVPYPL
jgi:hypothetical protein